MSEFLNPQEITALTGYVMPSKQADWLKSKSIPHKIDGTRVIVATAHTRAWLEGRNTVSSNGPNWAALKTA